MKNNQILINTHCINHMTEPFPFADFYATKEELDKCIDAEIEYNKVKADKIDSEIGNTVWIRVEIQAFDPVTSMFRVAYNSDDCMRGVPIEMAASTYISIDQLYKCTFPTEAAYTILSKAEAYSDIVKNKVYFVKAKLIGQEDEFGNLKCKLETDMVLHVHPSGVNAEVREVSPVIPVELPKLKDLYIAEETCTSFVVRNTSDNSILVEFSNITYTRDYAKQLATLAAYSASLCGLMETNNEITIK